MTEVTQNPARPNALEIVVAGPQGPKGDKGTTWLSGAGVPAGSLGLIEDWYLNESNGAVYEKTGATTWTLRDNITGPQGIQGIQGLKGDAATVAAGTTTTGAEGSNASVTNVGTPAAAVFNFTVPRGNKGDAATVAVGTVTTGAEGSNATVSNSGTSAAAVFNFTIPRGNTGRGFRPRGAWAASTAYLADDIVTNGGSAYRVTTNFTSPATFNLTNLELWASKGDQGIQGIQGVKGDTGSVGPAGLTWRGAWNTTNTYAINDHVTWGGSSYYSTTAKGANAAPPTGTSAAANDDDTAVNAGWALLTLQGSTGPQGIQGIQGVQGVKGDKGDTGTLSVGTTTTGAAGSSAVVTNVGTATNGIFNFVIPQGLKGDTGDTGPQGPDGGSIERIFTSDDAAGIPFISRGFTGQSGDLQQWQDSAGTVLAGVDSSGKFSVPQIRISSFFDSAGAGGIYFKKSDGSFSRLISYNHNSSELNLGNGSNVRIDTSRGWWTASNGDGFKFTVEGTDLLALGFNGNHIHPRAAGTVGLSIQAKAGQTGSLQEWKNSSGEVRSKIDNEGNGVFGAFTVTAAPYSATLTPSADTLTISGNASNLKAPSIGTTSGPLTATGYNYLSAGFKTIGDASGQAFVWQHENGGSQVFGVRSDGWLDVAGALAKNAGDVPFVARGFASQTANLQEWQNSAGTVVAKVAANGGITAPSLDTGGNQTQFNFNSALGTNRLNNLDIYPYNASSSLRVNGNNPNGTAGAAAATPLSIFTGATGQTADLQQWRNSAGTVLATVSASGTFTTTSSINFGADVRQMINLYDTGYGIGVQSSTQYFRSGGGFAWFRGGIHANNTNDAGLGGTVSMYLDLDGNLNTLGTISENGVRVYSANNPPPTPDISNMVTTDTVQTIVGGKTLTGLLRASGSVSEAATGTPRMDLGVEGGSPRIIFESGGNKVWEVDNLSGLFRWFVPGSLKMSLNDTGLLTVYGNILEGGTTRVTTVTGIPYHVGGSVPVALLKPKFIAPADMTLRSAYVLCETMAANGVAIHIYVNGASVAGPYTIAAANTLYGWDFADVNINAGDRVQLFVSAADATATELSVTVQAVAR